MSKQKRKKKRPETPAAEIARSTPAPGTEKERILLAVTVAACILPLIVGLRLWGQIPEHVSSGMTSEPDEAIPRYVACIVFPLVMGLLQLLAHSTLRYNNRQAGAMPATFRLAVAHWGFPVISVIFVSGYILQCAGQELTSIFLLGTLVGLGMLVMGSVLWDCKKDSRFAFHTSATDSSDELFRATQRFAAWVWYAAGLALLACAMLDFNSQWAAIIALLLCMAAPSFYARGKGGE